MYTAIVKKNRYTTNMAIRLLAIYTNKLKLLMKVGRGESYKYNVDHETL